MSRYIPTYWYSNRMPVDISFVFEQEKPAGKRLTNTRELSERSMEQLCYLVKCLKEQRHERALTFIKKSEQAI